MLSGQTMVVKGLRPVLGGVCCHNAQGCVRNRRSFGRGIGRTFCTRPSTCDKKTRQFGLNHDYDMTFSFYLVNVSIPHIKGEYGARIESHFNTCRQGTLCSWRLPDTFNISVFNVVKRFYHNRTYLQPICELNWQLWRCFWQQWLVESTPINSFSDWHGEYGYTRSPLLHTRLPVAGHM